MSFVSHLCCDGAQINSKREARQLSGFCWAVATAD
jgi:hypothetical protein